MFAQICDHKYKSQETRSVEITQEKHTMDTFSQIKKKGQNS